MAKTFDADVVNLACGGTGFIADDKQNDKQVNVGGPAAQVYDHKLCFNWGEDPANGFARACPLTRAFTHSLTHSLTQPPACVLTGRPSHLSTHLPTKTPHLDSAGNVAKYTAEDIPKADLVVIWLGQNDIITGVIEPGDTAKGIEKYTELLAKVREMRPQTPVLCLYHDSMMHSSNSQYRPVLEGFGVPTGYGPTSAYARQRVNDRHTCNSTPICPISRARNQTHVFFFFFYLLLSFFLLLSFCSSSQ